MTDYAGNPALYPANVRLAEDGQLANAAFLGIPSQDLADRTAWLAAQLALLAAQVGPVYGAALSSLSALKAINTTSLSTGTIRFVNLIGVYILQKPEVNGGTSGEPWKVAPTTGTGVWMLADLAPQRRTVPVIATAMSVGDVTGGTESTCDLVSSSSNVRIISSPQGIHITSGLADSTKVFGFSATLDPYLRSGHQLSAVFAYLNSAGGTYPAAFMPRIGVFRKLIVEAAQSDVLEPLKSTGGAYALDTTASDVDFAAAHFIQYVPDQNHVIDLGNYTYSVRFFDLADGPSNAVAYYAGLEVVYVQQ